MKWKESAIEKHNRMVREERLQAERVRTDIETPSDIWHARAHRFRPNNREKDKVVDILAELAGADGKVIDVGAGAGRIAVPLSQLVREIVAVEPSPAMRSALETEIKVHDIKNIQVIPSTWQEANVEPAEIVLASHVTYGIQDIEPFLRKMNDKALKNAVIVVYANPPQSAIAPFWEYIYGEPRLPLPCRKELIDVLVELGFKPEIVELPPYPVQPLGNPEEAFTELRRRLFIGQGHPLEERLRAAMNALTIQRDGLIWPRDAQPNERSMIIWQPESI